MQHTDAAEGAGLVPSADGRLKVLLHAVPVVLAIFDAQERLTLVEGDALRGLGLSGEALVGRRVSELLGDYPWVTDLTGRALSGESFTVERRLGEHVFELHFTPVREAGSAEISGALAVGVDVTSRRAAEDQRRQAYVDLAAILNSLSEGVIAQTTDGTVGFANEAAARALDLPLSEVAKLDEARVAQLWEFADDQGRPLAPADLPGRKALEGSPSPERLVRVRKRTTGEECWRMIKATPVMGPEQRVRMSVNLWWDVTGQKRAEQRLAAQVGLLEIVRRTPRFEDALPSVLRTLARKICWDGAFFTPATTPRAPAAGSVFISELDGAAELQTLADPQNDDTKRLFEHVLARKDSVWVHDPVPGVRTACASCVRLQGVPLGVVGVACTARLALQPEIRGLLDDAAEILADALLREREREEVEFHRLLLDCTLDVAPDGVLVVGYDRRVLKTSRRFEELWGVRCDLSDPLNDEKLLNAVEWKVEDPAGFREKVAQYYSDPDLVGVDEIRLRDGRTFERYTGPVMGESGAKRARVWFFRDITDRKQAAQREQQLALEQSARVAAEEAEARSRFLADVSATLASSFHDRSLLFDVTRLATGQLADWCVADLFDESGVPERVAVTHVDAGRSTFAAELQDHQASSDPSFAAATPLHTGLPVRVTGITPEQLQQDPKAFSPLAEESEETQRLVRELGVRSFIVAPMTSRGRVLGTLTFVSSTRDQTATEQSLAEDVAKRAALAVENARLFQLTQRAVHARDEFLAIASHELRTPITSVKLALQAMERYGRRGQIDEKRFGELLEAASRQTTKLGKLVSDLLDVTRMRAGKLVLSQEELELGAVVQLVLSQFHEEARLLGCIITLDHTEPVRGRWDRSRLEQVVSNLITNAMRYGPGRPIEVTVDRAPSGSARLRVRDHGIGIPAELQVRIFDPFERAVSSRHYGGLGLGLFITRQIVSAHGGNLSVESEVGSGSTFTVELPAEPGTGGAS